MDRKKYTLQDFRLLSVFGYGNYSKIALVRKKDDQKIYAMKVIKKEGKVKGSHPFVIKLHTTFQDSKRLFFIMDYCPGGELFSLIKRVRRIS
jgi:serum/glucocorticoid-regulated kinase 2